MWEDENNVCFIINVFTSINGIKRWKVSLRNGSVAKSSCHPGVKTSVQILRTRKRQLHRLSVCNPKHFYVKLGKVWVETGKSPEAQGLNNLLYAAGKQKRPCLWWNSECTLCITSVLHTGMHWHSTHLHTTHTKECVHKHTHTHTHTHTNALRTHTYNIHECPRNIFTTHTET